VSIYRALPEVWDRTPVRVQVAVGVR